MARVVILDVDGTLVDTNYHHTLAWYRAFRQHGLTVPVWRVHRHIGMGGDQLVAAVAGERVEARAGDSIRAAETALYADLIGEVQPFGDARRLLELLRERGHRLVLASSAKQDEVDYYLDLLDARRLADAWTTGADVRATKPEPDLVHAAIDKLGGGEAVLVGDSTFDCEAAARAGVPAVAILTGGFSEQELREAGARVVFTSIAELCAHLDETPLW
ncbi:MAG TPA: HAD family hydrolase [Actinomycetes bacterium]|jgi:phosphoglycolate phosphatase-like HAD superfamily hydrolase|nr:HAD family hydrolase [Actinomycetes bacterium]